VVLTHDEAMQVIDQLNESVRLIAAAREAKDRTTLLADRSGA
jgi:hypothetical protein|tara:strand:+ start:2699 stop:2824 length:126 start_codon:yes stop_codon:yes gene_type:complete